MKRQTLGRILAYSFSLGLSSLGSLASADVKVADVLQSHMVLQQELQLPIWGTASPGETITVRMDDRTASTDADAKGDWRVNLDPLKADGGKAHSMTISGKNTVTLEDLLIGEVWLGSGQSNMAKGVDKVGEEANQPQIRLGEGSEWKVCTPQVATGYSAVLYFFGQRLHDELKVPIGLINESRGSKPIEAFMPPPKPGNLYKELIQPLQPLAIRGVLWYQGEANRADGLSYAPKQQALVQGWRKAWGREFSFYLVQIAPFTGYTDKYDIPSLWEAQLTGLKIPGVGVAVINDTAGNMSNIHPGNKDKVGQRLAAWALAKDYGRKDIEYCSPMYRGMKVEGNRARLIFTHAKGLKTTDGKPPTEFEIAAEDGKYVPATATVDGEAVIVEAAGVEKPAKVRYAWRNTPAVTLVNGAGLPASSFHTDNWQGGVAE